jgi:hypothetical protein
VAVGVAVGGEEPEILVEDDMMEDVPMEVGSEVVVVDAEVETESVGKVNGTVVQTGLVVVSELRVAKEVVEGAADVVDVVTLEVELDEDVEDKI